MTIFGTERKGGPKVTNILTRVEIGLKELISAHARHEIDPVEELEKTRKLLGSLAIYREELKRKIKASRN